MGKNKNTMVLKETQRWHINKENKVGPKKLLCTIAAKKDVKKKLKEMQLSIHQLSEQDYMELVNECGSRIITMRS